MSTVQSRPWDWISHWSQKERREHTAAGAELSIQVSSDQVPPAAENEAFPITFWSLGREESEENEEKESC